MSPLKINAIHRVTLADLHTLQEIGRQTFFETFADGNTPENMERYLAESFAEEKLAAELSDPNAQFYFAQIQSETVGYLKLNQGTSQTEAIAGNTVEIERIYVLKAYHGMGVGQFLYEQAIQIACEANVEYVWLGVWEENPRAIRFYEKNGFVAFDKHIFTLGEDAQTDILMKLELKKTQSSQDL